MSVQKQPVFIQIETGQSFTVSGATSIGAYVENEGESFTIEAGDNPVTGLANTTTKTNKVPYNSTFFGKQQLVDHVFTSVSGTVYIEYFL